MLTAFKKYRVMFLITEAVILGFSVYFAVKKEDIAMIIVLAVVISVLLLFAMEMQAGFYHQRLLGILYIALKPADFIAAYEPLTQQKHMRKSTRFSMLAYLSNAYAAAGDFEKALEILDTVPELPGRSRTQGRIIMAGNRCVIHVCMGRTEEAEAELEIIRDYMDGPASAKETAGLKDTYEILNIRIESARGRAIKDDAEKVKAMLAGKPTELYAAQLRQLLGKIYQQLGDTETAAEYYKKAAEAGEQIWAAAQSIRALKDMGIELPEKATEEK